MATLRECCQPPARSEHLCDPENSGMPIVEVQGYRLATRTSPISMLARVSPNTEQNARVRSCYAELQCPFRMVHRGTLFLWSATRMCCQSSFERNLHFLTYAYGVLS